MRAEEQVDTWKWCNWVEEHLPVAIIHEECIEDYDYSKVITSAFNTGRPFITLEQDILPSTELLDAMMRCNNPIETSNYILYPSSTALGEPVSCNRVIATPGTTRWVTEQRFADFFSLGFTMFREVRQLSPIVLPAIQDGVVWWYLDHTISKELWRYGVPVHIHREPIIHNHGREKWENEMKVQKK